MTIAFRIRSCGLIAALALLAGCASGGVRESERADVQRELVELQADSQIAVRAPAELAAARAAVAAIDEARGAEAANRAAIARQRIEIARVVAEQRALEDERANLQQTHANLLLQAARRDARQARRELERQRLQAQIEAEQAERLLREAEAARLAGDQAAADAAAARAVAAQSRRIAAAQARAAELAKKEAALAAAVSEAEAAAPANDAPGPAAPPAAAVSLTLSDRSFEAGSATLAESGSERLARVVESANAAPDRGIEVRARVDRASDAKLVRQRAESVRAALVAAGIAANRVQVTEVTGRGNGVEVVLTD